MTTREDLEAFATTVTCPEDFDEFWSATLAGLAELPLEPSATLDPLRSNAEVNVYQATYRSLDGLEIFGWYSVPAVGEGPFPAILVLPGYKSRAGSAPGLGTQGRGRAGSGSTRQAAQQRGVQPRLPRLVDSRRREPRHI